MKTMLFIITKVLLIATSSLSADIKFLTHSCESQVKTDEKGELRGVEHAGKRGFYVELVREMMKVMKVRQKIYEVPLARGMLFVQKENDYVLFNVIRIPERENTVKWVGPIWTDASYLYEFKKAPTGIKTLEDAKKVKSIGVVRGGVHEKTLLSMGFTNTIPVTEYKQTYQMLIAGRINLFPAASISLEKTLKDEGINPDDIQKTPVSIAGTSGYITFSKNISDEVINQWQKVFDQIKKSGKYKQLYDLYFLPEKK